MRRIHFRHWAGHGAFLGVMLLPIPFAFALPDAPAVKIAMEDCEASRPGRLSAADLGDLDTEQLKKDPKKVVERLREAMKGEKLVKKGRLKVAVRSYDVYLPEPKPGYSWSNPGGDDSHHRNTSTLLSIDADADGKLSEEEGWFASLPIRIEDTMWEVVSIAPDGGSIELKHSRKPLAGVVTGRRCPPFSYRTEDGKQVTLDSFKGKALLIDIWSVT